MLCSMLRTFDKPEFKHLYNFDSQHADYRQQQHNNVNSNTTNNNNSNNNNNSIRNNSNVLVLDDVKTLMLIITTTTIMLKMLLMLLIYGYGRMSNYSICMILIWPYIIYCQFIFMLEFNVTTNLPIQSRHILNGHVSNRMMYSNCSNCSNCWMYSNCSSSNCSNNLMYSNCIFREPHLRAVM